MRAVKSRLLDSGITPEKVDLLDALLQYAGEFFLWPILFLLFFSLAALRKERKHKTAYSAEKVQVNLWPANPRRIRVLAPLFFNV